MPGGVRVIFLSSLDANVKCFGLIGTGNTFCLKERKTLEDGTIRETCGYEKHLTKFEPDLNTYYIPERSISACTNPSIQADQVLKDKREVLDSGVKTGGGWRTFFRVCQAQTTTQKQPSNPFQPGVMFVKNPAKGKDEGKFEVPQMNLPDQDNLEDDADLPDVIKFLRCLAISMGKMWSAMLGFCRDVEANYELMREDISKLHIQVESEHARIGDQQNLEQDYVTV